MAGLTMLLAGIGWALGVWVSKAVQHFKQGLVGHPIRSMEGNDAEGDLNCEDPCSVGFREKYK